MRATLPLLALLTTSTLASAQYLNQTAPFELIILSSNKTLNSSSLGACHEGAAIEGLCLGGGSSFTLNYTSSQTPPPSIGTEGYLTYELQGGNFNLSSPLSLSYNPTSNVAVPLFTPSDSGTVVAFDKKGLLSIPSSLDDTVYPPVYDTKPVYRWYVCETDVGYQYQTLAWGLGAAKPQNPTCQKVKVLRVFV